QQPRSSAFLIFCLPFYFPFHQSNRFFLCFRFSSECRTLLLTLPTAKAGGFLLQPLLHWIYFNSHTMALYAIFICVSYTVLISNTRVFCSIFNYLRKVSDIPI